MLTKWLTDLGVFVLPDFLEAELCTRLCAELRDAPARLAAVNRGLEYHGVDESFRRTKVAQLSAASRALLTEHLTKRLPALSTYFQQPLLVNEGPICLRYTLGDFFLAHRDNPPGHPARPLTKARRVSVIVFLNQGGATATQAEAGYEGGELVFYGLLRYPGCEKKGFTLSGKPGWLIAFRSDLRHEILPVRSGERYSVVTWLTDTATAATAATMCGNALRS